MDKETKQYVDKLTKKLAELLVDHNNTLKAHTTDDRKYYDDIISDLDFSSEDLTGIALLSEEGIDEEYVHPKTHPASMIVTDPQRRFISDLKLSELESLKVDKTELKKELKDTSKELKTYLNTNLNNILNSKNVAQNLRVIASIVSQDDNLSTLLTILQEKADIAMFQKHADDISLHMTDGDVFLLEQLEKILTVGIADWNATDTDPNYIANKPAALPADGGDADTVSGYTKDDLLKNKRVHTVVIGCKSCGHTTDEVDYVCDGTNDSTVLKEAISKVSTFGGTIYFREGEYRIDEKINIFPNTVSAITICGCGDATKLTLDNIFSVGPNTTIRNLFIKNNDIVMLTGENIRMEDCSITSETKPDYVHGSIEIGDVNKCRFCRNNMKNILINYTSVRVYNSIFSENIFDKCNYNEFSGGANVFSNNVQIV